MSTINLVKMWAGIPQGWQIFIAGCVLALFILAITLSWSHIEKKIWGKHPDTYVYVVGLEKSYMISQLREAAPIRSKITLHPIKFPEGVSSLTEPDIPIKLFNWDYPENTKLYTIVVHNRGDGIDRNIKIDVDFTPNSINFVKINNEERISLIQGGKPTGSRAIFKIAELLPNERQDIEILIEGKNIRSVDAWSQEQQRIEKIFIFDMVIEPE